MSGREGRRIRVLLYALRLAEGRRRHLAGNFSHVANLARELARLPGLEVAVLCDEVTGPALADWLPPEALLHARIGWGGVLRADWVVARATRRWKPDVYHRPTGQLPFFRLSCRAVATVADLNFRTLPTPPLKRLYKELSYRRTLRRADWVTCISEFTRGEVLRFAPVNPQRITVIPHGVPVLPAAEVQPVLPWAGPFWLAFGHQAHKNVETVLHALRRRPPAEGLIVAGWCPHVDSVLRPLAATLGVSGRVVFAGRVSGGHLHALYQRAQGLVFLSRYEGFGLPVLEAMSAGCPVICSNVCSLPEVGGQAAVLLDPDDADGAAEAMETMSSGVRQEWIERGRKQAGRFRWEDAAAATGGVYSAVMNRKA